LADAKFIGFVSTESAFSRLIAAKVDNVKISKNWLNKLVKLIKTKI